MTGSGRRGAPMVREPTIEIVCERADGIFHATGVRGRDLPICLEKLLSA